MFRRHTRYPASLPLPPRFLRGASSALLGCLLALVLSCGNLGCGSMKPKILTQYVYVTAKQGFLRDRIAAVSNRTGTVANGDKLAVLEHGRRFIRVRTEKGEVGWLEEKSIATQETFNAFKTLATETAKTPPVASAVVRDEVYMHLKPGRDTDRFYRLAEGDKLRLLARATLPKAQAGAGLARVNATSTTHAAAPALAPKGSTTTPTVKETIAVAETGPATDPQPVAMEDWWLVRDQQDRTGWIYSRMMDVDAPDALTRYGEGQRFVGAYVLTTVYDAEAPQDDKNIPIFVAVLSPYKAGLPYDFNQVRVFTWSLKRHRYETAYREKNIEGFLPVTTGHMKDPYGRSPLAQTDTPSFTYNVLPEDAPRPVPDALTGAVTPARLITKTYRLEQTTVRRILPPGQMGEAEAHPEPQPEKGKKGKKKK